MGPRPRPTRISALYYRRTTNSRPFTRGAQPESSSPTRRQELGMPLY